jgi:hypothetical protein
MILVSPEKTMGECFRNVRPVGQSNKMGDCCLCRAAVDLLEIENWKAEPRKTGRGYVFS